MVAKSVAKKSVAKEPVDWGTIGALGAGGAALGLGLFFWMRKTAFAAGDDIYCRFKYQHAGPGGAYNLRVVMGHTITLGPIEVFDEMEETRQEFAIIVPESAELEPVVNLATYQVPEVLAPDKYDVEASLRYVDGSIVSGMRVIANDIVEVGG